VHHFTPSPVHAQPLDTSAGGTKKYACQNFQNFHPFPEENDVNWKIWKIYMRFSRGKRLFSKGKSFSLALGKYKPRVFPSEIDFAPNPPWKIWKLWRGLRKYEYLNKRD